MRFLLIFFLLPLTIAAQQRQADKDITGVWTGSLYNDTTRQYIHYELAISEFNGKYNGYSHTTFIIDSVKNTGVKAVKIKNKKGTVLIEDAKLIDNDYAEAAAKGVRTFIELLPSENDSAEVLSGTWYTNKTREYNSLTGTVFLERKKKIFETLIVPKLQQIGVASKLSFFPANSFQQTASAAKEKTDRESPNRSISSQGNIHLDKQNANSKPNDSITSEPQKTIIASVVKDPLINKNQERLLLSEEKTINADKKVEQSYVPNVTFHDKENSALENKKIVSSQNILKENNEIEGEKKDSLNEAVTARVKLNVSHKDIAPENIVLKSEQNEPLKQAINERINGSESDKKPTNNTVSLNNKKVNSNDFDKKDSIQEKEIVLAGNRNQTLNGTPGKGFTEKDKNADKTNALNIEGQRSNGDNKISVFNVQPVPKKEETSSNAAGQISSREIETIRTVQILQDSLVFTLYDNGAVDGDTVSILLNGTVIMPKVGLSEKAYNKTIYLTPEMGDSINIIMYAENLGSIPPNTGLLVVRDGAVNYEIRFTGDLKKNSAIILKRKRNN